MNGHKINVLCCKIVDDYYFGPLEQIDKLVQESKVKFLRAVSWNPEFQVGISYFKWYCTIYDN